MGQIRDQGAALWWSVPFHRWCAAQPEDRLMAGEHSSGGGSLSHLCGSWTFPKGSRRPERAQARLRGPLQNLCTGL